MKPILRRFWPIILAILGFGLIWFSGLHNYLTADSLAMHRASLKAFVLGHSAFSYVAFLVVYIIAVALSVPGAVVLTLLAGLLFGIFAGSVLVVVSATIGAILVFLIARSAIGESLSQKAGPALTRLLGGFKHDAVSYLLFLRLVPLFPFWLVNLAAALAGVSMKNFAWTTFVGIMPGSIAFVAAGAGADSVLAAHGEALAACKLSNKADCVTHLELSSLVTPQIVVALALLGFVALIPLIWRKIAKQPGPE